jgi:integrase
MDVTWDGLPVAPEHPTAVAIVTWRRGESGTEFLLLHRLAPGGPEYEGDWASAYADQGYVFTDEIGDPLSPAWVSSTFVRRVKQAGLPRISLHGLRHSFATVALEAGVDVLYVSEILGHSTPTVTQNIYQHVRRERLEGAVDTISEAIHG